MSLVSCFVCAGVVFPLRCLRARLRARYIVYVDAVSLVLVACSVCGAVSPHRLDMKRIFIFRAGFIMCFLFPISAFPSLAQPF